VYERQEGGRSLDMRKWCFIILDVLLSPVFRFGYWQSPFLLFDIDLYLLIDLISPVAQISTREKKQRCWRICFRAQVAKFCCYVLHSVYNIFLRLSLIYMRSLCLASGVGLHLARISNTIASYDMSTISVFIDGELGIC